MKMIVAGSRTIVDTPRVFKILSLFQRTIPFKEVISGTARGPDTIGAEWAKQQGVKVVEFRPDWDKYGKAAGYKRNEEMADYAGGLIAFWDYESKGTKHMIDIALNKGLLVIVIPLLPTYVPVVQG